jgi:hypothetical protein
MIEEDPTIIQMNIAHYRTMLKLHLDDEKRSVVERLLAEASDSLTLVVHRLCRRA